MENINLIRKIAWSVHNSTGEEWDDLFQEAALAYCEALKTYDPKKGKITTYMWHCISSHLKNYLKLQNKQTGHIYSEEEIAVHPSVSTILNFETLSRDAQQVAEMVLNDPGRFLSETPKGAREKIAKTIFKENHWSWNKVRVAIQDLRLAYS